MGHLERRDLRIALSDGDVQRFATIPRFAGTSLFPRPGRDQTRLLVRKINACGRAEAAGPGKGLDAVDAHLLTEHIVIDVAGMQERLDHVHGPVAAPPPATEFAVAELDRARAHHPGGRRDAFLEKEPGHHELPDRTRRIDALDGAVLQGMERIVPQRLPGLLGQAADKKIVVIGGVGHQSPQPPGMRLHDHDAPRLIPEKGRELFLQLNVKAEPQVFAVLRLLGERLAKGAPEHVHFHAVESLVPAQALLKDIFEPLLAYRVAQGKVGIGGQFLFIGFSHIAEDMREFLPFRVVALGAGDDFKPRPMQKLRLDARHLLEIHVRQQQDGLEGLDLAAVLLKTGRELLQRDARPLADLREGCGNVLAVLPDEREAEGGPVLGQQDTPGVADEPARGVDRLLPQMVGLRLLLVIGSPVDLQIPETQHEGEEEQPNKALQERKPGLGRLITFRFKLYCFHGTPPTGAPACTPARGRA